MCQKVVNGLLMQIETAMRSGPAACGDAAWHDRLGASDLSVGERRALRTLDVDGVARFLGTGTARRTSARTAVKLV